MVQGRRHLSGARSGVSRLHVGRRRRFSRTDEQARLPRRARHRHPLAAALLPVAPQRRWVRHRGLQEHSSGLRDARGFRSLHRRGASPQHPGHHRARHQPHVGPASRGSRRPGARRPGRRRGTSTSGARRTRSIRACRSSSPTREKSNWTWDETAGAYYWHRFFHHQPDLNFDNPAVLEAVVRVMHFWLDRGVDGMRLDAVPYLIEREGTPCANLDETHAVLKRIRAEMDARHPDRVLLAEANQWPAEVRPYFGDGDECHMAFHFPLMPRMFMAVRQEDRHPIVEILRQTPDIPETCQWGLFLRNHDELTLEMVTDEERDYMYQVYANDPQMRINGGIRRRLAPLMENSRRRIELMNSLLFSLPGTPVIYYGDEIGMGDNIYLGDRNGVRTPMQWTGDRNAGFSRADAARLYAPLITDPVYGFSAVNVEAQERAPFSLLNWMKRMIGAAQAAHRVRTRRHRVRVVAEPQGAGLRPPRRDRHDSLRRQPVAQRAAGRTGSVALPWHGPGRDARADRVSTHRRPAVLPEPRRLRLQLVPPAAGRAGDHRTDHAGHGGGRAGPAGAASSARSGTRCSTAPFARSSSATCSAPFLHAPAVVPGSRARAPRASRTGGCSAAAPSRSSSPSSRPSSRIRRRRAARPCRGSTSFRSRSRRARARRRCRSGFRTRVVARVTGARKGALYDAWHDARFADQLLEAVGTSAGDIDTQARALPCAAAAEHASRRCDAPSDTLQAALADRRRRARAGPSTGRRLALKLFRRVEPGVHPEVEISQHLADVGFARVPVVAAVIDYARSGEPSSSIGMFTLPRQSVESQVDGWTHAMDWLSRLFDQVAARDLPAAASSRPRPMPRSARAGRGIDERLPGDRGGASAVERPRCTSRSPPNRPDRGLRRSRSRREDLATAASRALALAERTLGNLEAALGRRRFACRPTWRRAREALLDARDRAARHDPRCRCHHVRRRSRSGFTATIGWARSSSPRATSTSRTSKDISRGRRPHNARSNRRSKTSPACCDRSATPRKSRS